MVTGAPITTKHCQIGSLLITLKIAEFAFAFACWSLFKDSNKQKQMQIQ